MRAVIIDNDVASVRLLKKLLSESGVDVVSVFRDGKQALKWIDNEKYDILFLDIKIPGMDGIALADFLAKQHINIPVIFVTADQNYAVEAFRVNAVDYLLKPVDKSSLSRALKRLVGKADKPKSRKNVVIECFGGFTVKNSEGASVNWRTTKAEELFAYLVERGKSGIHRDKMIDDLWPDFDTDRALTNLNSNMYYVRRGLEALGLSNPIVYKENKYWLIDKHMDCDLWTFEEVSSTLHDVSKNNIHEYEKIIRLYKGEYLEERYYVWALYKQADLLEAFIFHVRSLSEYYLQEGNIRRSILLLKRALRYEPLSFELNRLLIMAYYKDNDIISAKRRLDSYKRKVTKEYGKKYTLDIVSKLKKL